MADSPERDELGPGNEAGHVGSNTLPDDCRSVEILKL